MNEREAERFKRQMIHDGFTARHQENLRNSTVLLAGIGGLGGAIAYALAGAGIGRLILAHSGPLTESNLNRQTLMNESAVGKSRAQTAAARLREYSSFVHVEAHDVPITEETLNSLAGGVDLIIDARHNFPERRALNRVSVESGIPLLFAAMDGLSAQMALFIPGQSGCLTCLYPDDPPDWDPFGFPVFGAVSHAIGAMAGMEAVKYLSGYGSPCGKLVVMDLIDYSIRRFALRPIADCGICGGKAAGNDRRNTFIHIINEARSREYYEGA
ncbi:MAG: HesA/MoeB/ThiF family protein [Nitrospinae bacterium]|nr:HesA/MoeB/ThiF family protein [Nitrospinota bacterium]